MRKCTQEVKKRDRDTIKFASALCMGVVMLPHIYKP